MKTFKFIVGAIIVAAMYLFVQQLPSTRVALQISLLPALVVALALIIGHGSVQALKISIAFAVAIFGAFIVISRWPILDASGETDPVMSLVLIVIAIKALAGAIAVAWSLTNLVAGSSSSKPVE